MATRTITGLVHHASGAVWVGATVTFEMTEGTFTISPDVTFLRDGVTAVTDAAGAFTVTLTSGLDVYWRCSLPDGDGFRFALPAGSATTIEALRSASEGLPVPVTSGADILITNGVEDDVLLHNGTQFINVNAGALLNTDLAADLDSLYVPLGAINAKGDLLVGGANDFINNLPVGADGEMLVADSGEVSGVGWSADLAGHGQTWELTRTLAGTANTYVDIGTFTQGVAGASHAFQVSILAHGTNISQSKVYAIASKAAGIPAWATVIPLRDSAPYITDDFELLAIQPGNDIALRVRRVSGAGSSTLEIRIENLGSDGVTFTPATTTSTDATAYGINAPDSALIENTRLLIADSSAIGPTIADYFSANSAIPTRDAATYLIDWALFYTKTTAGTATYTIVSTTAPTRVKSWYQQSAIAGIDTNASPTFAAIKSTTATSIVLPVTGTLATAVDHFAQVRCIFVANTAGNVRLRVTSSAGTITPLADSYFTVRRLLGNVGSYLA
jgi:hypothetical protein